MNDSDAPLVNPNLPTQASLVINTEAEVLNTTKLVPNSAIHNAAEYTYRKQSHKWKRALVTIYASDQDMTLFVRNLSGQVASPAADGSDWKITPDGAGSVVGTTVTQGANRQFSIPFFGDDTKITIKPGGTKPTVFRVDVRLSPDQALNG